MSFNSNRNSRDGKPNRMNKTNNENRFSKDRGSRTTGSSAGSTRENPSRSFDKDRKPGKDSSNPRDRFSKNDDRPSSDRKSFGSERKSFGTDRNQKPRPEGRFSDRQDRDERPRSSERNDRRPNDRSERPRSSESSDRRSTERDERPRSTERYDRRPNDRRERPRSTESSDRRSTERDERPRSTERNERSEGRSFDKNKPRTSFADKKGDFRPKRSDKPFEKREVGRPAPRKRSDGNTSNPSPSKSKGKEGDEMRLNRYIANAGVCSRRKADELIAAGVVSVNGEVVTALGTKVNPGTDDVRYNGERLKREKMVYVLLNKPKDYITTTDDPQERRTVMHLVEKATQERIYPVGRLDRNTTGLLLMTNDGSLAEKLSHPRNSVTKIYHVELDKNLLQGDLNKIQFGLELEDGLIKPDEVSYVQGASKREIGIQIHSGKNRIVRRIFESLGYDVIKLDRVIYANLTKKDLPRGRWRYLDEREVVQLKHFMK